MWLRRPHRICASARAGRWAQQGAAEVMHARPHRSAGRRPALRPRHVGGRSSRPAMAPPWRSARRCRCGRTSFLWRLVPMRPRGAGQRSQEARLQRPGGHLPPLPQPLTYHHSTRRNHQCRRSAIPGGDAAINDLRARSVSAVAIRSRLRAGRPDRQKRETTNPVIPPQSAQHALPRSSSGPGMGASGVGKKSHPVGQTHHGQRKADALPSTLQLSP
jgi:hypothetical protein